MRVPYKKIINSGIRTIILIVMIALLTITTYGANWGVILANSIVIFVLSIFANFMGDLIIYFFDKRKELKDREIIEREVKK